MYGYVVVDDDIQLDELDALKADLLSLQASVHKLACQLLILQILYFYSRINLLESELMILNDWVVPKKLV